MAGSFIAGKLKNSRQILLRGARESTNAAEQSALTRVTDNLNALLRALPQAADLDTLRGVEGEAARGYLVQRLVRPARELVAPALTRGHGPQR